ncbi:MAG: DNA polymerase I, partial [Planctomycetes bacterium]|nr:DNA polymerase I [Planctomycetota bacterium]
RMASLQPTLQNIPMLHPRGAEVRSAFIPSGPELTLISADYSQIELRVLADACGDEVLLETFRAGDDIHSATAAKVAGVPLDSVSREMRSRAKAVNFGLIYGMGPRLLAQQTGMAFKDAQAFIKQYFETFPSLGRFLSELVEKSRERGFATTL